MNHKVIIYAYTNFNLGDDLFIKLLCERYTKTQFILYAPKEYERLFRNIKNIKVFPRDTFAIRAINYLNKKITGNTSYMRNRIKNKCDAAVYIGGSLFMQNKHWKLKYNDKKNMYIENKPFYLMGANFGPYYDDEFYLAYKDLFSNFTDICFRDNYSYELFRDLPNVRMADDIVFQLDNKSTSNFSEQDTVVISVIKPSIREHLADYDDIYYKTIRNTSMYLNEKGYHVTLMSFCEREGDKEAIENILGLLPKEYNGNIDTYFYKYDIEQALNIIKKSKFVIATRFHSMILGWLYNKPVFPIVYSEKMTNVMNDVGFKGLYTEFKNLHKLHPKDVYNSIQTNLIDVTKQIENSEAHFLELDKLLLDKS